MSKNKAKSKSTDITLERAKYAGNIQTAISILHCSLKKYILKTIEENCCIITIDKTDDFSDLLKFIVNNWEIVFSQNSDHELYKLASRCIQINKSVCRQALCFDRELEHLIKLGKIIKCSNIDYFANSLIEPSKNDDVGEGEGESKNWLKYKNDGNDFFKKGKFTEAVIAYSKAIAIDSTQSVLYSNRALCELKLEKYDLAREDAEDAIALESNNAKFYRILTESLWNLGLYKETENVCEEGLKIDPYDETLLLRKRNALARIMTLINDKNPIKSEEITEESIKKLYANRKKIYDSITPNETEIEHIDTMDKLKSSMSRNQLVLLAHSYRDGVGGVKKDLKKAIETYRKAAKEGSAEALYNLGVFYGSGVGELVLDYARMLECFEKAAAQKPYLNLMRMQLIPNTGVAESMNALGNSYRDGRGVDKDAKKAFEYYKLSAYYNYSGGQNNLGCFLYNGIGVQKNEVSARYWYQRAADQEIAEAQFNYAEMLERGSGGEKDEAKALEYYKKAAEQGLPGALERIQILSIKGSIEKCENVRNVEKRRETDSEA
jgi:TPR repeat protein